MLQDLQRLEMPQEYFQSMILLALLVFVGASFQPARPGIREFFRHNYNLSMEEYFSHVFCTNHEAYIDSIIN